MFKFTIIAVILFITTAINIIATVISWRRAKSRFGFYFAVGMTGITFWTLVSGLDYAAVPIPLKVFFTKLEYVGYHIALIYFLMFVLAYAGYGGLLENKFVRALLWVVPASNVLLAWTNEWHQWLWSGFVRSEFGDNTVIFEHGPAFLWVAGTGYLLIVSIVLTAWLASRRGAAYARRQGRLLFYGSLLPLLGNLIYQFQPFEFDGVDWSSILLSISSLLFLWALYGTHLLDLIPIAREKLIESLGDGMIVLDMQGRIIDINQPAARMIGSAPEKLLGRNVSEILPSAQHFAEQSIGREIRTELEFGDAEKRYFDVLVSPLFEGKTAAVGHLIILRDITVRKQNELRLLQLNQGVEQSPMSVVITDLNGNITYVNSRFTALTGYTFEDALGKNPKILQSGQTPIEVYRNLWRTIKAGKVWKGEFRNKKKNGELYWEDATIAPVLDHNGRILNFIAVKEDITERKHAQDELHKLAITDSLTGLFNRRHFFAIAEKEFAKSARYHRPLSVILFDIDLFKDVNDTYGHIIGDQTLIQIGKLLLETGRQTDVAARYGGEEFVILLTETDCADAKIVAERLRKLMEDSPIQSDKGDIHFSASFGVAGMGENAPYETLDRLISQADQALYEAKRTGRNRVVCYR
jgi:diguanylate cyclase (GGDEF)-like protein/PAS domain S-box-containing protein